MAKMMKSFWALIPLILLLWCPPASAKYCTVKAEGKSRSCIFKVDRIPHNSQIIISYTKQGWSMLIVVFMDEFAIIEGPATVKIKGGKKHTIEHMTTQRDMTPSGRMMEAPIYKVSEELLRELGHAKGKVRFWLRGEEIKKDKEVEVAASLFSDMDAYIEETKTELAALFQDE